MHIDSTTLLKPRNASESFAERWAAVQDFADEIGQMAALSSERPSEETTSFPERIASVGGARWTLAQEALSDIDAMLQPGVVALRAIAARGQDTTAPALALWREFHASRKALLSLAEEFSPEHEIVAA